MITILIDVLLPIAVVATAGFALRRTLPLDLVTLNRLMIYGLSPALIFVALVRADLRGPDAGRMLFFAVGVLVLMALTVWISALVLRLRGKEVTALLLTSMFMNSGNYGLPASRFAFGEAGFTLGVFYFIMQSIMAQTLGVAVAAAGAASGERHVWRQVVDRLIHMPQLYAVAGALALRWLGFNPATASGIAHSLFEGVALLSEAALPIMLLILGVQLGAGAPIVQPTMVAFATAIRLIISPLLAFGLARLLGMDGIALGVGVMMAGMPTAVNTTILAIEFDTRPQLVVSTVVVSSFASLVTLSILLSLVR
ncbi:AEC family transporter [Chloroflexus sp.]|uniref:AEC family transporter n=1 Tax=Chloroflexus sp. TaxID=1904827 RepID=UPI0026173EF0|nr:AEC family transporter [uncultured Chloroflexus sp.]